MAAADMEYGAGGSLTEATAAMEYWRHFDLPNRLISLEQSCLEMRTWVRVRVEVGVGSGLGRGGWGAVEQGKLQTNRRCTNPSLTLGSAPGARWRRARLGLWR